MKKLIREAMLALAATALALPACASGLLRPVDARYGDLEIKQHKVRVLINNGFAKTEVDQVFHNPHDQDLEAVYSFPVPEKASMSELSLWIDGKEVIGEVLPKEQARAAYESEKAQGRDAGLNEKNGYQAFEVRVTPVRAQKDTRVRLVYYQPLAIDTGIGRYVYPMEEGGVDDARDAAFFLNAAVAGGETGGFSLDVKLKTAYPIEAVFVASHPDAQVQKLSDGSYAVSLSSSGASCLRRDFVLNYRLADDRPAGFELLPYKAKGRDEGSFMLVVTPGAALRPIAKGSDWTFILDVSGSMQDKLGSLADGVEKALGKLRPEDRFRIAVFNDHARWLIQPYTAANEGNVRKAVADVRALAADGSTDMYSGLQLGLGGLDAGRSSAVLLVTDGVANTGIVDPRKFLELMRQKDVRLFTFVMGNSANRPLLEDLAAVSGGFAVNVSNADSILGQLLLAKSKLTHEAMHGVTVRWDGVKTVDLTPSEPLTLYRGEQLVVFGKYQGSGKAELEFQAEISGAPMRLKVPVTFPAVDERNPEIERLWALARIRELEYKKQLGASAAETEAAIRDLGTRNSLVTDYTSMVVMSEEQFSKHGIARDNARRVGRERAAQAQRASAPQPAYSPQTPAGWSAPNLGGSHSGGGGSLGPLFGLLSALAALAASRRKGSRS